MTNETTTTTNELAALAASHKALEAKLADMRKDADDRDRELHTLRGHVRTYENMVGQLMTKVSLDLSSTRERLDLALAALAAEQLMCDQLADELTNLRHAGREMWDVTDRCDQTEEWSEASSGASITLHTYARLKNSRKA